MRGLGRFLREGPAHRAGMTGEAAALHAFGMRMPTQMGAAAGDIVAVGAERARRTGIEARAPRAVRAGRVETGRRIER